MKKMSKFLITIFSIVLGISLIYSISQNFSYHEKNQVLNKQVRTLSHKNKKLMQEKRNTGGRENQAFLDAFFTYKNGEDRYQAVNPLLTKNGLADAFPSGDMKQSTVQSTLLETDSFFLKGEEEVSYLNLLKLETSFNDQKNVYHMVLQTTLNQDKKITHIQVIATY